MKRMLLALTFVASLGAAGFGLSSKASAGHGCYDDYGYGGYGYRPYGAYYGDWGYPRFSYYGGYYPHRYYRERWHGGHRGHHHHDHGGVYFSIGF